MTIIEIENRSLNMDIQNNNGNTDNIEINV